MANCGIRYPAKSRQIAILLGQGLSGIALLFASGDLWPTIRIGFTFRLSQLCIFLSFAFLLGIRNLRVKSFPGQIWIYLFLGWIFVTLPFSAYLVRSLAYAVWTATDVLLVWTYVQYFQTPEDVLRLLRWFILSFTALAWFGWIQFLVGLTGHSLFVSEWWFPGVLPRVNGLSYEPSYYATYLLPGWVFSGYLIETKSDVLGRRLLRVCFISISSAMVICTSRMGWVMMALWFGVRGYKRFVNSWLQGKFTKKALILTYLAVAVCVAGSAVGVLFSQRVDARLQDVDFLAQGLGLFGETSHSTRPRIKQLEYSWSAFLRRPIMGSGVGSLPAQIAADRQQTLYKLSAAKKNEGLSIFLEVFSSTGIIGGLLMTGFGISVLAEYRKIRSRIAGDTRKVLAALGWGILWELAILQFNQTFQRIYLFTDLAVLMVVIVVLREYRDTKVDQSV